ncbi:hypothetical protein OsJ_02404 [Oryza sativa Japonica Group]|uniref:Band 7 domain-containing protein n=1 Tax=Oryza sativa subsp. japonica TaxID=39947 RepID=B9EXS9_ORYSJ|nr:hypothetical protein OsJ_02404 [Oryza sativa Japonica Group]
MGNLLCCVEVEESTVAMRERFGKFDGVMEPGCHFVPWFLGLQARGPLSLRLRQLEIRCPTKTKDNVYVTIVTCVQYRALADKASHAFYTLINTRSQIQAHVFDVLRTSIPKLALEEVFDKKKEIAEALEEEIRDGLLQAVQPPAAAAAASVAAVGLPLPLPVASVCEGITEEQ